MTATNNCIETDRATGSVDRNVRSEATHPEADTSATQFRAPKILLIEDNDDHARILETVLTQTQSATAIHRVSNGEQALQYLDGVNPYKDRIEPDLVILDLGLPRISGHDVLRWIKDHKQLQDLPVIVITASRESTEMTRAYRIQANGFLTKPISSEHLAATIRNLSFYWTN